VLTYIVRRVLIAIPLLWGVLTLVFVGVHLIPGDAAQIMLFGRGTAQDIARLRHELGLDQPLPVQYVTFLSHAVRLDFGRSIVSSQPVFDEIWSRWPSTLELVAAAMLLAIVFGFLGGVVAAAFDRRPLGAGVTGLAILAISLPEFWVGTMLALVFGVKLAWLPVSGVGDWRNVVLPAVTLALPIGAGLARLVRGALLEVLDMQYLRTARSKGVPGHAILVRHALRNALIPVVTVLGLTIASLLGGVVIIENVFSWPGLGSLAVTAVATRDFPVVEGITFVFAVILILANLIVDISYAWLDPRIHYS
jgi:ABC-type dipeptide/oligopeptide/nickel transport system permease component